MIPGIHHVRFLLHARTAPSAPQHNPSPLHHYYIASGSITINEVPTLNLIITPSNPRLFAPVSNGDIVAVLQAFWSDGSPFIGNFSFTSPYFDHDGDYTIDSNDNLIVANADNLNALGDITTEHVSIEATQ